jgi:hypothetical protein
VRSEREGVEMAGNKKDDSGKHGTNSVRDGYKKDGYNHSTTKDVSESSGGRHSKDDKDERDK